MSPAGSRRTDAGPTAPDTAPATGGGGRRPAWRAAVRAGGLVSRLTLLAILLVVSLILAVRMGAVSLTLAEIVDAIRGRGDASVVSIVRQLRLPRAVQAALVGAALSMSGATFQALVRNPLAEPYILGVSSGAAVGAVAAIVLGVGVGAAWGVPAAAFAGAILAIVMVFRIASGVGAALDTHILLLGGVVVAAFFNAIILLLLTLSDVESFRSAMFWMMGSNAGASWRSVLLLAAYVVPAGAALVALARSLDLMALGERTAAYLGTRVERTKLVAYTLASLLAAVSVAASGVIGFVGLVVPHVVRMLWGSSHRSTIPASALLGASFLVLADLIARMVARPTELPIGVVTAFLGVPFFIWLLRRRVR